MCPLNEVDYIRLVSSEDTVMDKFNPKEGDVVVDIGAHLGRYSIISSKRVTEKSPIYWGKPPYFSYSNWKYKN